MQLKNQSIKGANKVVNYILPLEIYNKEINIYIGPTFEDARDGAEKDFNNLDLSHMQDGYVACYVNLTNPKGHMANLILIGMEHSDECNLLETCAHEAVHASWYILDHVGVEIDALNHEAQAYLVDHIFSASKQAVENYIKRYKLKVKL